MHGPSKTPVREAALLLLLVLAWSNDTLLLLAVVRPTTTKAKAGEAARGDNASKATVRSDAGSGAKVVHDREVLVVEVLIVERRAAIRLLEGPRVMKRRVSNVAMRVDRGVGPSSTHAHAHPTTSESEVDERLLLVVASSANAAEDATVAETTGVAALPTVTVAVASAVVVMLLHVLPLELGLNPLAVRRVADHRKDRPDALDEKHSLARFGIVERRLDDVVGERVPEEFLESVSVKELGDEDLARLRLGDSDALLDDIGREFLNREGADVADELAGDSVAEPVVVEVEDVLLRGRGRGGEQA